MYNYYNYNYNYYYYYYYYYNYNYNYYNYNTLNPPSHRLAVNVLLGPNLQNSVKCTYDNVTTQLRIVSKTFRKLFVTFS